MTLFEDELANCSKLLEQQLKKFCHYSNLYFQQLGR